MKIVIIVEPGRFDFYNYLNKIENVDFYLLWYVKKKDVDVDLKELPINFKGFYYWGDYITPNQFLNIVQPDRIIFFEIIDQRQIALIIAAKTRGVKTFYLEHGAAGDRETAIKRREERKVSYFFKERILQLFSRITSSIYDVIKVKRFYYSVSFMVSPSSKKSYLKLPAYFILYNPNKALTECIFPERVPEKLIPFNWPNFLQFELYTGANSKNAYFTGVPFFDIYYNSTNTQTNEIIYIDSPYLEQGVAGWTEEHHAKIRKKLKKFIQSRPDLRLLIKLHPTSNFQIWQDEFKDSSQVEIMQKGQPIGRFLGAKLILSFVSSLTIAFLCAKKNCVLLGWHPKPQIFGRDFSKFNLCHVSTDPNDLDLKLDKWIETNLADMNVPEYEKFLMEFNYPFDGKATDRVIEVIKSKS